MLNLDNLKKQAKQIVRWHREGYFPVAQRIRAVLPRYRDFDDSSLLSRPFTLSDAHELIARELGFESWELLRSSDAELPSVHEQAGGDEPQLLAAFPQLFVSDVEASCQFFAARLGFTVRFKYGQPAFYALVQGTPLVSICVRFTRPRSTGKQNVTCYRRAFLQETSKRFTWSTKRLLLPCINR